jgi:hypothetical protein
MRAEAVKKILHAVCASRPSTVQPSTMVLYNESETMIQYLNLLTGFCQFILGVCAQCRISNLVIYMNRDHYEICEGIFLAILNGYVKFKEFTGL